ncbi:MAG: DMT family transporter [Pseudomonadota bacterium]
MQPDRPYLGILLMLGFCCAAPMGDATAKLIGAEVALSVLLFVRFFIQALVSVPISLAQGRTWRLPPRVLGLTLLRSLLHIAGIGCMFLSLRYLPLADAVAIAFVMPFIMLLLGYAVLGEQVGVRRLSACAVGFAGTLMVIQPSFALVGAPALLPLAVAVIFALFMLVTRAVAKAADPITLQAISGVMTLPILLPVALIAWLGGQPGADPALYSGMILVQLGFLGLLGTLAHLMMVWALRFAPSATLAPMQYLEIPMATLVGWLVFRDFPNGLALIGIVVTTSAGLYVIARERGEARRAAPLTPAVPPPPT